MSTKTTTQAHRACCSMLQWALAVLTSIAPAIAGATTALHLVRSVLAPVRVTYSRRYTGFQFLLQLSRGTSSGSTFAAASSR
jgi:hypothetical protein